MTESIQRIAIRSDLDIVAARVEGRNLARQMGFDIIDQARIATAISELTRNVVLYAKEGILILKSLEDGRRRGLEVVCEDQGPGIADLELVMQDGYSSQRGLGMGLPGTRRLMDEFDIQSEPGKGTTVIVRKWLR
jgi:serine/threonine-protein kinase RsbT